MEFQYIHSRQLILFSWQQICAQWTHRPKMTVFCLSIVAVHLLARKVKTKKCFQNFSSDYSCLKLVDCFTLNTWMPEFWFPRFWMLYLLEFEHLSYTLSEILNLWWAHCQNVVNYYLMRIIFNWCLDIDFTANV